MEIELQISAEAIMSHFCWGYTNALLKKLKELIKKNRIFDERGKEFGMGQFATLVVSALEVQLGHQYGKNIEQLVKDGEEFLAIFEKKE